MWEKSFYTSLFLLSILLFSTSSFAQVDNDTVLCVSNTEHPFSTDICAYYVEKRPGAHWLNVTMPESAFSGLASDGPWEHSNFSNIDEMMRVPINNYTQDNPQIKFLAIAKGLPIRVSNNASSDIGISAMWYLAQNISVNFSSSSSYLSAASPGSGYSNGLVYATYSMRYFPIENTSYFTTSDREFEFFLPGDIVEYNNTNFTIITNYMNQNYVVSGPYEFKDRAVIEKYYKNTSDGYVLTQFPHTSYITTSNTSTIKPTHNISYFVSYLTGYTLADIKKAIDKATSSFTYTDEKIITDFNINAGGPLAIRFVQNTTVPNIYEFYSASGTTATESPVFGYIGWGVHQGKGTNWVFDKTQLNTTNKSIATSIESFNARTFDEAAFAVRGTYGSSQGLIADLLTENASNSSNYNGAFTGVFGHINEPYTTGVIIYERFLPLYLGGVPFAEASTYSWRYMLHEGIAVGDPLMTVGQSGKLPLGERCNIDADCSTNICATDAVQIKRCTPNNFCNIGFADINDSTVTNLFVQNGQTRCVESNFSRFTVTCSGSAWSSRTYLGTNETCSVTGDRIVKDVGEECSSDSECKSMCVPDFFGTNRCTDSSTRCPISQHGAVPTYAEYCSQTTYGYCIFNASRAEWYYPPSISCTGCQAGMCANLVENETHIIVPRGRRMFSTPFELNITYVLANVTGGFSGIRYDATPQKFMNRIGSGWRTGFITQNITNKFTFATVLSTMTSSFRIQKPQHTAQDAPVQIIRGQRTPVTATLCAREYNASQFLKVVSKFDSSCAELYYGGEGFSEYDVDIREWWSPTKTTHMFGAKNDFNMSNYSGYLLVCSPTSNFVFSLPCNVSQVIASQISPENNTAYQTYGAGYEVNLTCQYESANNLSNISIHTNISGTWTQAGAQNTFNASAQFTTNVTITTNESIGWYCSACDLLEVCNNSDTRFVNITTNVEIPDTINPLIEFTTPSSDSDASFVNRNYLQANISIVDTTLANISVKLFSNTGTELQVISNTSPITTTTFFANFTTLADANYSINATAVDRYVNTNSTQTRSIVVDTKNPNISYVGFTQSLATNLSQNWIAINVSANDTNLHSINISVYNDASVLIWKQNYSITNGASEANLSLNLTGLTDGIYFFNATTTDFASNVNHTITRNITIDTRNPNISYAGFTQSLATNLSQNWIAINVSANDTNLREINISLFDSAMTLIQMQNYTVTPGVTTSNLSYNATGLADGIYWFNATALDHAGNRNGTALYNVTIDTLQPNISYVTTTDIVNVTRNYIQINASFNDTNIRYANISFYNSAGTLLWRENYTGVFGIITNNLSLNRTTLADGNYSFNASVTDWTNKVTNTTTQRIIVDATNPNISYAGFTESHATNLSRNWIAINVSANDTNLRWINISVFDSAGTLIYVQNSSPTTGATTANVALNLTNLPQDTYWFNATALDWIGNSNYTATFNVTTDTINPNISYTNYTEIANTNLTRNWFALNVTANDTHLRTITIFIYNQSLDLIWQQNYTHTNFATQSSNLSINITGLADGLYWFNASATDFVANRNTTQLQNLTIDTTIPTIAFNPNTQTNATTIQRTWALVNVTANDTNLRNVSISLMDKNQNILQHTTASTTYQQTSKTYVYNFTNLADANYTIIARAQDWAGNTVATGVREFEVSLQEPNLTLIRPLPDTTINTSIRGIEIELNVTQNIKSLTYYEQGRSINLTKFINNSVITAFIPINRSGLINLTFRARTISGTTAEFNRTIYFNYSTPQPFGGGKLYGNDSNIITNKPEIKLFINKSTDLTQNLERVQDVNITSANKPLLEFAFNFSDSTLNISALTIRTKDLANNSGIVISGLNITNKTVYLDMLGNTTVFSSICIRDAVTSDFDEISSGCNQSQETYVNSIPTTIGQYTITYTNSSNQTVKITGLTHSGILQTCTESWVCGSFSSCNSGTQTRICVDENSCGTTNQRPAITQSCTQSSTTQSSGGGGGGGSGGAGIAIPRTNATRENTSITGPIITQIVSNTNASEQQKDTSTNAKQSQTPTESGTDTKKTTPSKKQDTAFTQIMTTLALGILCVGIVGGSTAYGYRVYKRQKLQQTTAPRPSDAAIAQLVIYIKRQAAQGHSYSEIEEWIATHGWDKQLVDNIIQDIISKRR